MGKTLVFMGAYVLAACSSPEAARSTPPREVPAFELPDSAPTWMEASIASIAQRELSAGPWTRDTCAEDLEVARCTTLPAAVASILGPKERRWQTDWCDPDARIAVRCSRDRARGRFSKRSVLEYEADGRGYRRFDQDDSGAGSASRATIVGSLPNGDQRTVVIGWESTALGYWASAAVERDGRLLHEQTFVDGLEEGQTHCETMGHAQRCWTLVWPESKVLRIEKDLYRAPSGCLEVSQTRDRWGTSFAYIEDGDGPLAWLLQWPRTVWGGPPADDEEDIVSVRWRSQTRADGIDLMVRRHDRSGGTGGHVVGWGQLEGSRLCACRGSRWTCPQPQHCHALSPGQLDAILSTARRELSQRLPPRKPPKWTDSAD